MDKPQTAEAHKPKRIMLVEDEVVTAMDIKSNLVQLGYEVPAVVSSGENAVRKAAELRPDLILMDITLAGPMSGIEAADKIQKKYAIPIVFLTAHFDAETIGKAKATNPFGYLPKPCSMDTLMSTIEVALYKAGADAQRRKAEAGLKQVVNEQKIILDNIGIGVLFLKNRKIIWGNRSLSNIFGYSFNEIEGRDTELFYPDRESYLETGSKGYAALTRGEIYTAEVRMKKKDGSIIWCKIIGHAVNPENLEDGTIWLLDDITERRKTEEYLIRARNLESLGILAGGIAHDFNNLLQGLLGNIDMAKLYTPETSKAFPFLKSAESAYHAASKLTNQLLVFSSGGISIRKTIKPADLIRDAVSQTLSGSDVRAHFDLPGDLLDIHVDMAQFRQVIGNITLNAREAMPSGRMLLVSAANEILKPQDISELAPGNYIKISIQDQGSGIPPDILPKIFDPYFSTKERGTQRGMGLGLTISDAIVRKHNGVLTVETEPGKGTAFHIYLPAAVSEFEDSALKRKWDKDVHKTGPRILIMDDEPAVFRVTGDFLELFGYRVDSALNGDEAVQAFKAARETGDPYAAVILDLTIPVGMGGKEAIIILQKLDPEVKAIISSGYANDPVITDYTSYGFTAALVKPYRLEELKEILEKIVQ